MSSGRKITVILPEHLIRKAQKASGKNLTATLRKGLEIMAAGEAYRDLLKMKGKVKLNLNLKDLRKDRGE